MKSYVAESVSEPVRVVRVVPVNRPVAETELPLWSALGVALGIPVICTLIALPFGLLAFWLDAIAK